MSNTYKHAKRELDILFKNEPNSYLEEFQNEILALCDKFGKSGQSGGSATFTATDLTETIKKLCLQETITPIYNDENEWNEVAFDVFEIYQNNRCSSIFKNGKYNKAYYLDAIFTRTAQGDISSSSFWLNKEDCLIGDINLKIKSYGYIKSFPFKPKTFYIDVIEEEITPNNFEKWCVDASQLDAVYKYYDKE